MPSNANRHSMVIICCATARPDAHGICGKRGCRGSLNRASSVRRCTELLTALDVVAGGCTLCGSPDFERGGFGARTMIICDQCEREFHIGCLKNACHCELDKLPEGTS